jgi:plastocyanin
MKKQFMSLMLGIVVIAGLFSLGSTYASQETPIEKEPAARGVTTVTVDDFRYSPRVIKVTPGTEVVWTFQDSVQHDVRSATFGSSRKKTGTFTYTFEAEGIYEYLCSLHPNMTGRVVVTAD